MLHKREPNWKIQAHLKWRDNEKKKVLSPSGLRTQALILNLQKKWLSCIQFLALNRFIKATVCKLTLLFSTSRSQVWYLVLPAPLLPLHSVLPDPSLLRGCISYITIFSKSSDIEPILIC